MAQQQRWNSNSKALTPRASFLRFAKAYDYVFLLSSQKLMSLGMLLALVKKRWSKIKMYMIDAWFLHPFEHQPRNLDCFENELPSFVFNLCINNDPNDTKGSTLKGQLLTNLFKVSFKRILMIAFNQKFF